MSDADVDDAVNRIRHRLEVKLGPIRSLYRKVIHGEQALWPPARPEAVDEAEDLLGFALPSLLRAVYTQIGNGGIALCLLGLCDGQHGFELFRGLDLVGAYESVVEYTDREHRRGKCEGPWPAGLVPMYDGHGCAMVSYLDCNSAAGEVLIWDPGGGPNLIRDGLTLQYPSLLEYFESAWPLG